MGLFQKLKQKKQAQAREAARQKQRILGEIARANASISKFESQMERKLRLAVNKAIIARNTADQAALKNAYIDIRMSMRFRALSAGLKTTMSRLQSNIEFASIAEDMGAAISDASALTALNPNIDVAKLDELYNKVVGPLASIAEQMEQFNDIALDSPYDDYAVTDEDVEKLINQSIANPGALTQPPIDPAKLYTAPPPADSSVDSMIDELNELAKRLGAK